MIGAFVGGIGVQVGAISVKVGAFVAVLLDRVAMVASIVLEGLGVTVSVIVGVLLGMLAIVAATKDDISQGVTPVNPWL